MKTSASISMNITGNATGEVYQGQFTVETVITRSKRFEADRLRRMLLGQSPNDAPPDLQVEAFMISQLAVRVMDAPKFWQDSNNGQELKDSNVIEELFKLTTEAISEREKEIDAKTEEAVKKLKKNKE
jgi:hypothetical protein